MGTINVTLPADGTTADVSDYNTPITTIVNEINGNLDNDNIDASAAIATSKLADDAGITAAKIGTGAVTATKVADGIPVQVVNVLSGALATTTTVLPFDDTIPQNTEGAELLTLAITPKSATNILVIDFVGLVGLSAASYASVALFQDSTAAALAANAIYVDTAGAGDSVSLRHTMVAGTTSATTFKIRGGPAGGQTFTFNGVSGARRFGGITVSSIVITEYKAA